MRIPPAALFIALTSSAALPSTPLAQPQWLQLCRTEGTGQNRMPPGALVDICRDQALAANWPTYSLGCQNPNDPGLIMFTRPYSSTSSDLPQVTSSDWSTNNPGRFADEYLACAKSWGATR
jgi:hypothetical protein